MESILDNLDNYITWITPFTFTFLNQKVEILSQNIDLPADTLRYVLSLFAVYPMAMVFSQLPTGNIRHLFSFTFGLLIAMFVLGNGWIHSMITSLVTFGIVKWCGRHKLSPYIVFAFNMIYLSGSHIYRIYVDYMGWSLDFTGPQMILVIKLTSFAFNYYDGVSEKVQIPDEKKQTSLKKVFESRKRLALYKCPSVLEFMGFAYCFSTFLAGPAFEMREYLQVANLKNSSKPGRFVSAVTKLFVGVFFMIIFTVVGPHFPVSYVTSAKCTQDSFLQRVPLIWLSLLVGCRVKYYFAWKVGEGAANLSGFGFEGFNEHGTAKGWNAASSVDIIGFETAQSVRNGSRTWNQATQTWLERYVYARTGNSLVATYFMSAFWHGFYPGYYLFFMSVPLATEVNRLAYKRLRPYFLQDDGSRGSLKLFYDAISFVATSLCMNYMVMPFIALSWERSLIAYQRTYFAGHIGLAAAFVMLKLLPARRNTTLKKQ